MLRALVLLLNIVVALTWAATASSSVAGTVFQAAPLCENAEAGVRTDANDAHDDNDGVPDAREAPAKHSPR